MKPYIRVAAAALFVVVALVMITGLLTAGRTFAAWCVAGATVGLVAWLCPYPGPDGD